MYAGGAACGSLMHLMHLWETVEPRRITGFPACPASIVAGTDIYCDCSREARLSVAPKKKRCASYS